MTSAPTVAAQARTALVELAHMYGNRHGQRRVPGSWIRRGACRGEDPNLFFPDKGEPLAEAKAICRGCPVQPQCLDWAITNKERHGVWGGLSAIERRRIWRTVA